MFMRVIGLGMWVPKFYASVVGCFIRVVSGGVCLMLGFVVSSFVRDACSGWGVVGV